MWPVFLVGFGLMLFGLVLIEAGVVLFGVFVAVSLPVLFFSSILSSNFFYSGVKFDCRGFWIRGYSQLWGNRHRGEYFFSWALVLEFFCERFEICEADAAPAVRYTIVFREDCEFDDPLGLVREGFLATKGSVLTIIQPWANLRPGKICEYVELLRG